MKPLSFKAAVALLATATAAAPLLAGPQPRYEYRTYKPGMPVSTTPAAQPKAQLSTNAINFGDVLAGGSTIRQVAVSNPGPGALTLTSAISVSGDAAFGAGKTSCGDSLAPGAECLVSVVFSPTAIGAVSGQLSVASSGGTSQVALSGKGVGPYGELAAAAGSSADFGSVVTGGSATRTLLFTNTGAVSATGVYAVVSGVGLSVGGVNTCGTPGAPVSLAPSASCQVEVRFAPLTAGAVAGAEAQVVSSALNSPSRLALNAVGVVNTLLVTSSDYGGNMGANNNLTAKLKLACDGKETCSYQPFGTYGGDPYPGKAKDHSAEFSCGEAGSGRVYGPAEAGFVTQTISCPALASRTGGVIAVTSATWGANLGGSVNNLKPALAGACDGRKVCEFGALEVNGAVDPFPTQGKALAVSYTCNGVPKSLTAVAGDAGRQVLACP